MDHNNRPRAAEKAVAIDREKENNALLKTGFIAAAAAIAAMTAVQSTDLSRHNAVDQASATSFSTLDLER